MLLIYHVVFSGNQNFVSGVSLIAVQYDRADRDLLVWLYDATLPYKPYDVQKCQEFAAEVKTQEWF